MSTSDADYIWTLSTHVSSPGIGILVWDIIVLLLIFWLTLASFADKQESPQFPEIRIVLGGLVFLSFYYTLHVIDLAIHVSGTVVPYGYLFVTAVFSIPRTISDVLTLLGCFEIYLKYLQKRPETHNIWWLWSVFWLLALAQTCMLFGLVICWMSLVDGDAIEKIAWGRSALEVSSAALSFMLALVLMIAMGIHIEEAWVREKSLYSSSPTSRGYFSLALWPLVVRTFCEVVLVGEYNRNRFGISLDSASKARDVCHGLFSIGFVFGIWIFIESGEKDRVESMRQEVDAKLELVVDNRLNGITARGSRTAPQLSKLFEELKRSIPKVSKEQDLETRLRGELSLDYLDRLSSRYEGWVPIHRWLGATPKP